MRVAIIGDTHLPRGARRIPERCLELVRASDVVVHTGDFTTLDVLEQIERLGPPLVAVHGNIDAPEIVARLPEQISVDLGGPSIGIVHDAGPRRGRLVQLRAAFPDDSAVVFGHSHLPLHERERDFQIFNPGSPTERRRAPAHTMGLATVKGDAVEFEHVILDRSA
jgi:putative phosphoesterase